MTIIGAGLACNGEGEREGERDREMGREIEKKGETPVLVSSTVVVER